MAGEAPPEPGAGQGKVFVASRARAARPPAAWARTIAPSGGSGGELGRREVGPHRTTVATTKTTIYSSSDSTASASAQSYSTKASDALMSLRPVLTTTKSSRDRWPARSLGGWGYQRISTGPSW